MKNNENKKKSTSHPHDGHRQRMRERYYKHGLDSFADHEVLEFLLYYCYPRGDTNPIAHNMISKFGSLHNLLEADVKTLQTSLDCSEKISVLLNLIPQLANRYFRSKWGTSIRLTNERIAGKFAIDLFVGKTVEMFYVLCMDKNDRLINAVLISKGTLDETAVYPREVVIAAIQNNASRIILTHNHPSGAFKPSRSDLDTTRRIVEGLELIQMDVVDHIIAAGDKYYSFAARKQHVRGYD